MAKFGLTSKTELCSNFGCSGRGATRAEDAPGTPTQSHISPSILVYEENISFPGSAHLGPQLVGLSLSLSLSHTHTCTQSLSASPFATPSSSLLYSCVQPTHQRLQPTRQLLLLPVNFYHCKAFPVDRLSASPFATPASSLLYSCVHGKVDRLAPACTVKVDGPRRPCCTPACEEYRHVNFYHCKEY